MKYAVLVLLLVIRPCVAVGADSVGDVWPQFRGPTGQGEAADAELPLKWSEEEGTLRSRTGFAAPTCASTPPPSSARRRRSSRTAGRCWRSRRCCPTRRGGSRLACHAITTCASTPTTTRSTRVSSAAASTCVSTLDEVDRDLRRHRSRPASSLPGQPPDPHRCPSTCRVLRAMRAEQPSPPRSPTRVEERDLAVYDRAPGSADGHQDHEPADRHRLPVPRA